MLSSPVEASHSLTNGPLPRVRQMRCPSQQAWTSLVLASPTHPLPLPNPARTIVVNCPKLPMAQQKGLAGGPREPLGCLWQMEAARLLVIKSLLKGRQPWQSRSGGPWAGQHPCNLQHSSGLRVKKRLRLLQPQLQLPPLLLQQLLPHLMPILQSLTCSKDWMSLRWVVPL